MNPEKKILRGEQKSHFLFHSSKDTARSVDHCDNTPPADKPVSFNELTKRFYGEHKNQIFVFNRTKTIRPCSHQCDFSCVCHATTHDIDGKHIILHGARSRQRNVVQGLPLVQQNVVLAPKISMGLKFQSDIHLIRLVIFYWIGTPVRRSSYQGCKN